MREQTHPSTNQGRLQLNKRLYIILVCTLISALFWLLIKLSGDFPASVTVPVHYINMPGKKVVMNDLPATITVNLKANGFKILSFDFQKKQNVVEIDLGSKLNNISGSVDVLTLSTQGFLQEFTKQLGKEITITGFQPDSIVVNLSDRITRPVPVVLDLTLNLAKQYDTIGAISVMPSAIEVSGPPSLVNSIDKIHTEPLVLNNLNAPVKRKVKLLTNRLLNYSVDKVDVAIPVEKFTEGVIEVPVEALNVMKGYSLKTFPDKVKVRYIVSLSRYNKISSAMFKAVVDAKDLEKQHPDKVIIQLIQKPDFIRLAELETERLDYIMRKE